MIKHSLSKEPLLLLFLLLVLLKMLLSVACQAEPLTRHFILDLKQKADTPTHRFFFRTQHDQHTFSDIANTNGFTESDSPPDIKPLRLSGILKQGDHSFAAITMMLGSGHEQPQLESSESSGHKGPDATTCSKGFFTASLHSDSGGGNGNPEQHPHTLDLNCFIDTCRGVCQFRQSVDPDHCMHDQNNTLFETESPYLKEKWISFSFTRLSPTTETPETQHVCYLTLFGKDGKPKPCGKVCKNSKVLSTHKRTIHSGKKICDETVVGEDGQPRTCEKVCKNNQALYDHRRNKHTGQQSCDLPMAGEDGQPRTCKKVCKNTQALYYHKRKKHTGQQSCDLPVVGEDGQPRPCGKVIENAVTLSSHRREGHSGPQTCDVPLVGEGGQPRPCLVVCKNAHALSTHKSAYHTGQKTCEVIVDREDGQQQPCGTIWINARALTKHKRSVHSEQQTCKVTVVGEDGQSRPCGKFCKNANAISDHKKRHRKRKHEELYQNNDLSP